MKARILGYFILTILLLSVLSIDVLNTSAEDISSEPGARGNIIIASDTTWSYSNSPYYINGNILIERGTTLKIEPGVVVKFNGNYYIQVEGKLSAEGTSNKMITFTSNKTQPEPGDWDSIKLVDNNGNRSSLKYCRIEYATTAIRSDKQNGDLTPNSYPLITNNIIDNVETGINFSTKVDIDLSELNYKLLYESYSINNNIITNCNQAAISIHLYLRGNITNSYKISLEKNYLANNGDGLFLDVMGINITVSENIITKTKRLGIWSRTGGIVKIKNNFISYNNRGITLPIPTNANDVSFEYNSVVYNEIGIIMDNDRELVSHLVNNNNIFSNSNYNVYNKVSKLRGDWDFQNNWWGTKNTSMIDKKIFDKSDDFNLGFVNYLPVLTRARQFSLPSTPNNDIDSDSDGAPDYFDAHPGIRKDSDGDGLSDDAENLYEEIGFASSPSNGGASNITDSDGDGVPDEIDPNPDQNIDSDGDGLSDDLETVYLDPDPKEGPNDSENNSYSAIVSLSIKEGEEEQYADVDPDSNNNVTFPLRIMTQLTVGSKVSDLFIRLDASTVLNWPVSIDPSDIQVKPGMETSTFITVNVPPRTSYYVSDTLTVDGFAKTNPGNVTINIQPVTGSIRIKQFFEFRITTPYRNFTMDQGESRKINLDIENTGNARDTFEIGIMDYQQSASLNINVASGTNEVMIEESSKKTIQLNVQVGNDVKDGVYNIGLIVHSIQQKDLETEYKVQSLNLNIFVGDVEFYPDDSSTNETDSDGDGYSDLEETKSGSDPDDPKSTPLDLDGDGVPNENDADPLDPNVREKRASKYRLIIGVFAAVFIILSTGIIAYSRINRKNVLDHETRLIVYEYIMTHPGEHMGGLSRQLGINKSTLRYHLKSLQNTGQIKVEKDNKYSYYFPTEANNSLFLTPVQKEIIETLKQNGWITTQNLAEKLGRERQTILYHMSNLKEKGILKSEKTDNKVFWRVNREEIERQNGKMI